MLSIVVLITRVPKSSVQWFNENTKIFILGTMGSDRSYCGRHRQLVESEQRLEVVRDLGTGSVASAATLLALDRGHQIHGELLQRSRRRRQRVPMRVSAAAARTRRRRRRELGRRARGRGRGGRGMVWCGRSCAGGTDASGDGGGTSVPVLMLMCTIIF